MFIVTEYAALKLHVQYSTIVICIQYKFHEIPSIGYLTIAEDGKMDRWKEWTTPNLYPFAFASW